MPSKPADKMTKVAIVGGGPTCVYLLKNLLQRSGRYQITVFEAGKVAGCGIPYSEEYNTPELLANISSVEIPPVLVSLADWVRASDAKLLRRFGIARDSVGDRDFYPRILLGAYYSDQLGQLVLAGEAAGHSIAVETETRVRDIEPQSSGTWLSIEAGKKKTRRRFDAVVLTTGHLTDPGMTGGVTPLYRSPYPAQRLELGPDRAALILGSSLSAVDAVVALATRYGRFNESPALEYEPKGAKPVRLVMASRKGVLPDADFFYPIPEAPLFIFTPARLEALQAEGKTGLLDKCMALFRQQLASDDPGFLDALAITQFTPENFASAYFGMRQEGRGFAAIRRNLLEAKRNQSKRHTVMWRYTMMRAHEVFGEIVPFLNARDLERFNTHLTPVFADAYGCVPHKSIERLLALHRAGCLDVVALGDSGQIRYGSGAFRLTGAGREQTFGTFIDARGEDRLSLSELGFEQLDKALDVDDFLKRMQGDSDGEQFRLPLKGQAAADIFCLSIPVMMKRYPFAQGLVACADAARVVARSI